MPEVLHTLAPVFDAHSRILILGTMPSPKSRQTGFYYGNPQNKFWRVLQTLFDSPPLVTIEQKTAFLLGHRIALFDVLHACEIQGASDASIQNPVPNDFTPILSKASIQAVFTTGKTATRLFETFCAKQTGFSPIYLPSTSPANCANFTFEALVEAYRVILPYLLS